MKISIARRAAPAAALLATLLLFLPVQRQPPQSWHACTGDRGASMTSERPSGAPQLTMSFVCRQLVDRRLLREQDARLDLAIVADPCCRRAWLARAAMYWAQGDFSRARLDFGQFLRLKRRDAELRVEEL